MQPVPMSAGWDSSHLLPGLGEEQAVLLLQSVLLPRTGAQEVDPAKQQVLVLFLVTISGRVGGWNLSLYSGQCR